MNEPFQVVVRCKPSSERGTWRVDTQSNSLTYTGGSDEESEFIFSRVFEEPTSHAELYDQSIASRISSLLDGNHSNLALIAYGPPCGGKSHTIFGTTGQTRVREEARGVIYRCGEQLLKDLQRKQCVYNVNVSFLQVFQDGRVADLFDTKNRNMELLLDQSSLLYSVPTLTQQKVSSSQEVLRLVEKGYLIRNATGCVREPAKKTGFSSTMKPLPLQQYRPHCSHAVFMFTAQFQSPGSDEVQLVRVSVVDLAGKAIGELHSSLPCSDAGVETLQSVIRTLSSEGVAPASPLFVKSNLTKLLKPCFGGNCSTIIIANLSLSEESTGNCLQLLSHAQNIKNFSKKTTIPLSQSELTNSQSTISSTSVQLPGGDGESRTSVQGPTRHNMGSNFTEHLRLTGKKPPIAISSAQGRVIAPVNVTPAKMMSSKQSQPPAPPSPLFTSVRARANSVRSEQSKRGGESSDDSLSLDSESDSSGASALLTPVSTGPPPPPLRGIPHFNPDSPVSSQLTSTPLIPSLQSRPPSASKTKKTRPLSPVKGSSPEPSPCHLQPESAGGDRASSTHPPVLGEKETGPPAGGDPTTHQGTTPSPNTRRTLFAMDNSNSREDLPSSASKDVMESSTPQEEKTVQPTQAFKLQTVSSKPQLSAIIQVIPSHPTGNTTHSAPEQPPRNRLPPMQQGKSSPLAKVAPQNKGADDLSETVAVPDEEDAELRRSGGSLGDVSNTSSSLTLSSDSEGELFDEARDHFNPNMQQRSLPLHRPGYAPPPLPVLPPISQQPSQTLPTNHLLSTQRPHGQLAPLEHPPSYPGSSPSRELTQTSLPVYNSPSHRGNSTETSTRSEGNSTVGGVIDLSQQISNEEIHLAAMEGVKGSEMKRLAIQYGVDYKDQAGRTPLMYAVLGNQPKMCEVLIKLRAALNAKDSSGLTPLLWATYLAKPEVMRVLLKSGADVHCTDSDGRTLYHWAMKTPNFHCLKWLCKYANSPSLINRVDNEGLTALHWAVMADQAYHIRHLLTTTNADVSIKDKACRPPLNYAVLNFSPACIRAILVVRENAVNLTDNKGRTALHYACAEGSADCVRTLLSFRSCDLHCTDSNGTTPLHWAAAANQPGLIQLLIRRGADRAQQDSSNMTPLDHAKQRNHTECIKILQTYGLRRPSSALSIASHVSIPTHGGATPTLDEQGHVILRRLDRSFSLSGVSVSSINRLPADGQAGTEEREEAAGDAGSVSQTVVAGDHISTPTHTHSPEGVRRSWSALLCCGGRRSNVVVPE